MAPRTLALAVALLVVTTGCLGGPLGDSPAPPTAEWDPPEGEYSYPTSPQNLSNETLDRVVVAYEEAFVLNTLANEPVDHYGLGGVFGSETTVLNRSDGGAYVETKVGYWTTDTATVAADSTNTPAELHADGISNAVYFVSTETVRRVGGDDVGWR